jgi:hypothetical protein
MEETGCDRGEAELALEMCAFDVEEAIRTIARLLRHVVIVKGKFTHPAENQFGLFLIVANMKTGGLLRSRAVVSYNPAVYGASLDKSWFEFEKQLYGCRLWEGSMQTESLELERRFTSFFQDTQVSERLGRVDVLPMTDDVKKVLHAFFAAPVDKLQLKREILDQRQFQSLRRDPDREARKRSLKAQPDELLILKVGLEADETGVPVEELHAGDIVAARIVDARDIAQYLSKLFGGHSPSGPVAVYTPVEAIESGVAGMLVRVRFSVGVCGDADVPPGSRLRVVRGPKISESPWWRRIFK